MATVLTFPTPTRTLNESERAAGLITWQSALEAPSPMRADLCVACSAPTSAHFDEHGRHRGCAHALSLGVV